MLSLNKGILLSSSSMVRKIKTDSRRLSELRAYVWVNEIFPHKLMAFQIYHICESRYVRCVAVTSSVAVAEVDP